MNSAVIVFPGSNCDRDAQTALAAVTGRAPAMIWHGETALPTGLDLIVIPGGFSYGDYLRAGAMAARAAVAPAVKAAADRGVRVLGVCNGFQILCELGLLPGALLRNAGLTFVCRPQALTVANADTPFTWRYAAGERVTFPIAHHDGNYVADDETLDRLEGEGRVAFRYAGGATGDPNGSARRIAGITSADGRVLGLMPHPERAVDALHGGVDGVKLFESVMEARP